MAIRDERTERTAAAARACRADWAVLTSPDTVFYSVQHDMLIETGPSPFAGGPTTAFVAANGSATGLLVNNLEEPAARASSADHVISYPGLDLLDLSAVERRFLEAAERAARELEVGGTVAVQEATFPASLHAVLEERGARFVSIDHELDVARSTKTPVEIDSLRWCAHLASVGQRAALQAARPGRSELEIWADVRLAMERLEGGRMPMLGDMASGIDRTAAISGWPTSRIVEEGDPILCDLAPRARGYWGDSCNAIFVGEPSPEFMRLYETTRRSVEHIRETLRPGISAADFDRSVRAVFERDGLANPIHTGHGIGTGVHEWPRIVPGQDVTIQAGMVLMLEPGTYVGGIGGVRLERMFLVTETGNEILSDFEHLLAPA